jgi:hypothetical protein
VDDDKVASSSCLKGSDVINQSKVVKNVQPTTAARLAVILRKMQQTQTEVIRVSADSDVVLVKFITKVFWDVTPCRWVSGSRRFEV